MPLSRAIGRRRALAGGAAATALPWFHIRSAGAAGRLACVFFDHPVAAETAILRKLVAGWAEREKVEVQLDFIDAFGDRSQTIAAEESLARNGHDVLPLIQWRVHEYADQLEPVDELVRHLIDRYGELPKSVHYLANIEGSFRALPTFALSQNKPCCSRIDLLRQLASIDVTALFPVGPGMGEGYAGWTYDSFLTAAEKCFRGGYPFGLTMSGWQDAVDMAGSLFASFGATLVDAKGEIVVDSDNVRHVLDYARRLMRFVPDEVYNWDNASNNKALIAGRTALIYNPPSAWATAVKDAPSVGAQCWTHPTPAGPSGRFTPFLPNFWGIWKFAKNISAAKSLLAFLSEREQAEQIITAGRGYDLPPYARMGDMKVWEEEGPPKGTLFHYPTRPQHQAEPWIAGSPAPPAIGAQIYNQATHTKMIAKAAQNAWTDRQVIDWAAGELEGFQR